MRVLGSGVALALPLASLIAASDLAGQQPQPSDNPHIGHVTTSWRDTPYRRGFLPTAIEEAERALHSVGLALDRSADLTAVKMYSRHVLHAVDPSRIEQGPGMGYGVRRAAENVASHIEMAAQVRSAPQAVLTHSVHVATSARNTVSRADEIVALIARIQETSTASEAQPLVQQLGALTSQLLEGLDANADGSVGWQEGEGGLETAQQHVGFMIESMGR